MSPGTVAASQSSGLDPGAATHADRMGAFARTRKWRNWQTHQLEGLAAARSWGFESPLPHFTR